MHPGPMNRGLEISAAVADSPQSVILEQVANGVVVRMAVLYLLMGGAQFRRKDYSYEWNDFLLKNAVMGDGAVIDVEVRDHHISKWDLL